MLLVDIFFSLVNFAGTNMVDAFKMAFERRKPSLPTSILMITDGKPNSPHGVRRTIVAEAAKVQNPENLKITFVQVGMDREAAK